MAAELSEATGEDYETWEATITEVIDKAYDFEVGDRCYVIDGASGRKYKGEKIWGAIDAFAADDIKFHPEWNYKILPGW